MAKKSFGGKSVAVGAGIRTASEQLVRQLEKSGVSRQIIGQLRALLRQLPGGNLLKNAIRVWANKLDERVLAAIEPWLEELFRESESEETDMSSKGKKDVKGGGGNPAELDTATLSGTSEVVKNAMEVRKWLLKKSPQTFDAVMEVKTNMAYDSKGDNPAFIAWLASFHSLGEEDAVKQLKRLVKGKSSDDIAQMADVRQNYVTMATQIPAKLLNYLRGSPIKPEALTNFLSVVNADRKARGDEEIQLPAWHPMSQTGDK